MSLAAAHAQKTVHLIPKDAAIKRLCFDDATQKLRPNLVLVDRQGSVVFEINELGLKGATRDPARKLAVVWGDSVVFGVRWSWPCLLDELVPGYQFLNGGIEADPYHNILRRAAEFNRSHEVDLNIVLLGWHTVDAAILQRDRQQQQRPVTRLGRIAAAIRGSRQPSPPGAVAPHPSAAADNHRVRAALTEFLESTPNTVLVTMPTALNRDIVGQDLSPYFRAGGRDRVFYFAGDLPYSLDVQRYLFDLIGERNAIVREQARLTGARLVDLAAAFDTERLADFREDFFDVLHLRPCAYPKAAAAVYAGIRDLL
jgi:hypothetical protein